MLNTIKCKGEPTPTLQKKNYPAQDVNSAEVKKFCFKRRPRKEGHRGGLLSYKYTIVRMPAKKRNSLSLF